jgi:predicted phosphodiesterase
MRFLFLFALLLASCATQTQKRAVASEEEEKETVVAIFGDIHEDFVAEERMLAEVKNAHATHLIGMGDFIGFGGLSKLEEALSRLTEQTGIPRENIYLCPGNWELTLNDPEAVDKILEKYGRVFTPKYDQVGLIEIDGKKIRAGHFPQHLVPDVLLPPKASIHPIKGQITLLDTLARNSDPDSSIDLEIFAHTHVGGIYFDETTKVWSLNPGDLESVRKRKTEPQAFALWSPSQSVVRFVNMSSGETIRRVDLRDPNETCRVKACTFW